MRLGADIVVDPANPLPFFGAETIFVQATGEHPVVRSLAQARVPVILPLARSVGAKGDWVVAGRAALKTYLQRLNEPKQPDDAQFEALLAAPFTPPPKKKTNDRRF